MISPIAAMLLAGMEQATVPPAVPPPVVQAPPVIRAVPSPPAPPPRMTARARPLVNVAGLIGDRDYPKAALGANEQGTVRYALDVDPNGRVTGCTVTQSSGSAALDSATCRILQSRARFEPGRDASGRPAADRYRGRIAWRINRRLNQPFEPLLFVEEMRSDAAGALTCFSGYNAEPPAPKACGDGPTATGLASLARAQNMPLALSVVMKLTPEGAAEMTDGARRGDLFRTSEALLTIRADGSIAECRLVRNEWVGGGNRGVPPTPCIDFYPNMKLYRRAAKGTPIRSVKLSVRGYAEHEFTS